MGSCENLGKEFHFDTYRYKINPTVSETQIELCYNNYVLHKKLLDLHEKEITLISTTCF